MVGRFCGEVYVHGVDVWSLGILIFETKNIVFSFLSTLTNMVTDVSRLVIWVTASTNKNLTVKR